MKKFLSTLWVYIKATWQANLNYPLGIAIWILNGFITPLILMGVWLTIRRQQPLPLDENQIITYYLLSILVQRLTQSWTGETLGTQIKDGELSAYLAKPLPLTIHHIGRDIGLKAIRLTSLIPLLLVFITAATGKVALTLSISRLVIFIIAVVGGYAINFILETIMGLIALWLDHNEGAYTMFSLARQLLGGSLVPLILMPAGLQKIALFSPFRYVISFPIEILSGQIIGSHIIQGFLLLGFWLLTTKLLLSYTYTQGIKKYTAVGI